MKFAGPYVQPSFCTAETLPCVANPIYGERKKDTSKKSFNVTGYISFVPIAPTYIILTVYITVYIIIYIIVYIIVQKFCREQSNVSKIRDIKLISGTLKTSSAYEVNKKSRILKNYQSTSNFGCKGTAKQKQAGQK